LVQITFRLDEGALNEQDFIVTPSLAAQCVTAQRYGTQFRSVHLTQNQTTLQFSRHSKCLQLLK